MLVEMGRGLGCENGVMLTVPLVLVLVLWSLGAGYAVFGCLHSLKCWTSMSDGLFSSLSLCHDSLALWVGCGISFFYVLEHPLALYVPPAFCSSACPPCPLR